MAEIDVRIKALDDTKQGVDAASKNIDGLASRSSKSLGRLKGAAVGVGIAFAAVAGGKALAFLGGLKDSATAVGESVNALNVVFGDAAGTIIKFGETSATTLGLARGEFQQLSVETGTLLLGFGSSADTAADQTINLAQRATDLASVFNTDVDLALSAVNQALRGEGEAIRKFGVDVTDASLQTELLARGLDTKVKSLTAAEKGLLRYEIILARTDVVQGDFANTAGEVANQERIIAARAEDTRAAFGTLLLPAFQKVNEFMATRLLPGLDALFRVFRDHIVPVIRDFVIPAITNIIGIVRDRLSPSIQSLINLFAGTGEGGGLSGTLAAVGVAFQVLRQVLEPVIRFVFDQVIGTIELTVTTLTNLLQFIEAVFTGDFQGAWLNIQDIFLGIWDFILMRLSGIWTLITGIFGNFGVDIENVLRAGANGVIGIFEGMANGIIGAINAVITAWNDFELKLGGQTIFAGTPFEVVLPSVTISTPNTGLISSLSLGRLSAGSSTISASGGRGGGSGGGSGEVGGPSRGLTGAQALLAGGSTGTDLLTEILAASGEVGGPSRGLTEALAMLGASPAEIAAITAIVGGGGGGGGGGGMMATGLGSGVSGLGPRPGTVLLPQHGFPGGGSYNPLSNQGGPRPGTVLLPQYPTGIGGQPGPSPTPPDYPVVNIIVRGDINSDLDFRAKVIPIVKEAIRGAVA